MTSVASVAKYSSKILVSKAQICRPAGTFIIRSSCRRVKNPSLVCIVPNGTLKKKSSKSLNPCFENLFLKSSFRKLNMRKLVSVTSVASVAKSSSKILVSKAQICVISVICVNYFQWLKKKRRNGVLRLHIIKKTLPWTAYK